MFAPAPAVLLRHRGGEELGVLERLERLGGKARPSRRRPQRSAPPPRARSTARGRELTRLAINRADHRLARLARRASAVERARSDAAHALATALPGRQSRGEVCPRRASVKTEIDRGSVAAGDDLEPHGRGFEVDDDATVGQARRDDRRRRSPREARRRACDRLVISRQTPSWPSPAAQARARVRVRARVACAGI